MRISIIIPAKNEEKYLPRLFTSIKEQTFKDCEVIVADAGSKDSTREIANMNGAKVVEGGLPGAGRNRGAEAAKGEILVFIDADIYLVDKYFLEKSLAEFREKDFCVAVPLGYTRSDKFLDRAFPALWNIWTLVAEHLSPSAGGWCIFVKKETHKKAGGFDEKIAFGEDSDYVYRISKFCRFGILKSSQAEISPRRFDKEGYSKVFLQVLTAGFYRFILRKKYLSNGVGYKFDIYDKDDEK